MPERKLKRELKEPEIEITGDRNPSISAALVNAVEQVCALTGGDGSAIALRDSLGVRCLASMGEAPAVGTHLDPDSAFTRECLESGAVMLCDDAEADSRIQPSIARLLHLRSVVAVPIQAQGSLWGVLEVFSSRPSAFDTTHIAALQQIAHLLAPLLVLVSQQVERPAANRFALISAAEAPPRAQERSELRPSDAPRPPERLVDSPWPTVERESDSPVSWLRILRGGRNLIVWPNGFGGQMPVARACLAVAAALFFFALLCLFAESRLRAVKTSSDGAVPQASSGVRRDEVTMKTIGAGARGHMEVSGLYSVHRSLHSGVSLSKEVSPSSAAATKPAEAAVAAPAASEPPAQPDTLAAAPLSAVATSVPTVVTPDTDPVTTRQTPTVAPPNLDGAVSPPKSESTFEGMAAVRSAHALPAPVRGANLLVPVGDQIKKPLLVSQVLPEYPALARQAHIEGAVVVEILIEKSGRVGDVKVVSGPPALRQAAVDAVRRWKYQTTLLNGQPMAVRMSVTIRFTYS
ncbi:MAG: TonB family protein [Candidatus Acidiferrales bacterium]|jgi:protein TonB